VKKVIGQLEAQQKANHRSKSTGSVETKDFKTTSSIENKDESFIETESENADTQQQKELRTEDMLKRYIPDYHPQKNKPKLVTGMGGYFN